MGGPASAAFSPRPPRRPQPYGPLGLRIPWPEFTCFNPVFLLFASGFESGDLGRQVRLIAAEALPRNPQFSHPSHAKRWPSWASSWPSWASSWPSWASSWPSWASLNQSAQTLCYYYYYIIIVSLFYYYPLEPKCNSASWLGGLVCQSLQHL